jgi:septation ring formation regulator EzrA
MKHFFLQIHFSLPWFIIGLIIGILITILIFVTVGKRVAKKSTDRVNRLMEVNHELTKILKV